MTVASARVFLGLLYLTAALAAPQTGAKQKWPFFRFVRTLIFFDAIPKFPFFQPTTIGTPTKLAPGSVLFNMAKGIKIDIGPLDDIVMGGVSKTDVAPGEFDGMFSGFVSTANNGGFAGIRTTLFRPPKDVAQCTGFQLRIKGDGQRYKFIARDDTDWNGIAWSASFDSQKDKSTTVCIPIKDLKPTRFAKVVSGPIFDKTKLTGLQVTLSKFEYDGGLNLRFTEGPFSLFLEEVSMY